ncbi:MAG TPA: tetratricopeptide repeat protein [Bryobacteraceae bacterium]|jgi:tetratricopeptide (TPR) repeat protein|nr:tetratricopeptide repeat protein [Bryobacteraceae bacterium]
MHTLFLVLALAWQGVSPQAVEHAQAGIAARKQGHLDKAIEEFRRVTELAPDFPAGFMNLGAACMESRDYGAAIGPLKRALELDPALSGAHQMLGYALLAQGYAAESIPHFEKAGARGGLGIAQLEIGKLPEAIANLQAELAAHPNDPDLLYYLGRASGLLSKNTFDALLSSYPDSARSHQALAENYAALRRTQDAEKEYREALRQRPETPGIHLALGEVYAAASDWVKAEVEFRAEAKLQPGSAEAAYRLGSALLQQGKASDARAELARADRLRPEMPETLYALGKAASLDGDSTAARKAWTDVISIEKTGPLAAQAHFGLAGLYRKQGRTAEAEREMQEFRKLKEPASAP